MDHLTYSLIIPHYNTPHLLRRLLLSVPVRPDLEIIVVDDCSSKRIEDLNKVVKEFPSVSFYNTGINGGGGKARNIGLHYAIGKYVFFADADDYFTPGINNILDLFASNKDDIDLIFFDCQAVNSDTYTPSKRANHLNKYISLYKRDQDKAQLYLKFLFGEPWCKLIKKELIERYNIKFEENPVHNDTYFSYMVGYYAKTISVCPIVGYTLTERPVSVSTYKFSNKWLIRTEVLSKKNRFLSDHGIPIFDEYVLTSFKILYKEDKDTLKKLYEISQNYGFQRHFIIKKILNQYFRFFLKKIRILK